jgi:hypothetical protein
MKAIRVKAVENYEVKIEFNNGETRILDIKPYLNSKVFKPLEQDSEIFQSVKLDGIGGIEWTNGACLSPETVLICSKEIKND